MVVNFYCYRNPSKLDINLPPIPVLLKEPDLMTPESPTPNENEK